MRLSLQRVAARTAFGVSLYSRNTISTPCLTSDALQIPCSKYNNGAASKHNLRNQHTSAISPQKSTISTNNASSSPSISEHVRILMRQVPYPVAIITATDPTGAQDTASFRGMTVSSFNTVTLTPDPVISFNVRRPSETLNALLASGRFLVHLLAPEPATATLARDFSKGNATLAAMLNGHGQFEFESLDASESERPLPILRRRTQGSGISTEGKVDFPFVFECTLHPSKLDVQDHSIILGMVVRVIQCSEDAQTEELPLHRLCLTYANTKFNTTE